MTRILLALVIAVASSVWLPAGAQEQEKRLALVIGNGAYEAGALQTAANDAGLVAQTLQAAGFDVVGARDLDGETLRKSFRDFIQKVQAAGPNTVAFVYAAGYGVQLTGENYFIPVDAKIARDTDVPVEGIRLSDYMRQLSALPLKANVIVLDAARANPFAKEGQPLAGGLALVEPDPKMLIAFNAAPGTVAPEGAPPYGAYAQALAEMIRAGGLSLPEVFDRVRLRVNDMTKGAELPWDAQKVDSPFVFFERKPDAPPVQVDAGLRTKPIRSFDARDAYAAALERDTLQGYEDFVQAFPQDPLCGRVRAIVAARREAIVWRRTYRADTPPAYWSYLDRYPRGPHAADSRRRLVLLAAALEPPPSFARIEYDVPPPPPDEIVYVDRPVLYFDDPVFAFAPPPPPPVYFLPPPPPDFVILAPPPPPIGIFVLPIPVFVAMPLYVSPPVYVAPPQNNIIFANIHNTTVINNVINNPNPTPAQQAAAGLKPNGPAAAPSAAPSLPPAAVQKANMVQPSQQQGAGQPGLGAKTAAPTSTAAPTGTPANATAARTNPGALPAGTHALPGATNGQPLPQTATAPAGAPANAAAARTNPAAPATGAHTLPGAPNGQPLPQTATAPGTTSQPNAAKGTGTQPATAQPLNGKQTPASQTAAVPPTGAKPQSGTSAVQPSLAKPADSSKGNGTPSTAPSGAAATALAKPTPADVKSTAPAGSTATHTPPPPPSGRAPSSAAIHTAPTHAAVSPPPPVRSAPPPPPPARQPAHAAVTPAPVHAPPPPPHIAAPPPRAAAPPPPPRVASPPPTQQVQRAAPPPKPAAPARGGAPCPPDKCKH
jgi:uncharacterized caspase-like protein